MKNAPEESEPRLQHKIITKHVGAFQNMAQVTTFCPCHGTLQPTTLLGSISACQKFGHVHDV
jgi:hypothetical protein